MRTLDMNEVREVSGGGACVYAGANYSDGATVSIGNGWFQTCNGITGVWGTAFRLP